MRAKLRQVLPWLGLIILGASFFWWQSLPERLPLAERGEQTLTNEGLGTVVIDAGHGGQDSGKVQDGVLEKDLALDVARRTERILAVKGVSTVMTRNRDTYLSLAARAAAANREANAVLVSIHFDDARPTAAGVETYYANRQVSDMPLLATWLPFFNGGVEYGVNIKSQSLAGFVQEAAVARTRALNRGTRAEQFYVLSNVRHPAVLIEGGFLTNKEELARIVTEEYREQLANAIADGVVRFRDLLRDRLRSVGAAQPGA